MKPKIFVALSTFAQHGDEPLKVLRESGFDYSLNSLGRRLSREEVIELGKDADGIVAGVEPYDDYVLDNLPKLYCISRCGSGLDNISLKKAEEKSIKIFNTPDVVVQPVAEFTVGLILDLLKKITFHTLLLKSRKWQKESGSLLAGKKIGILGLGRIGKRVAEILSRLQAEVYGADIFPDTEWAEKTGVKIVSTEELLETVDVLSIHLSHQEDHPFQLGEKEISLMKTGAQLINVSRGQFVDEQALCRALSEGKLAGAALDVFSEEPYTGKLCEIDRVILTPHIATLTEESRLQMEVEATTKLVDFIKFQAKVKKT